MTMVDRLGPMRVSITHSVVQLQPKPEAAAAVAVTDPPKPAASIPTLSIDLKDGKVQVVRVPPLPDSCSTVLGIIGLLKLSGGSVLILVTKARKVSAFPHAVYKVTATQLVTHENVKKTMKDLRLAHLLQEAMDVKTYAGHMYFSFDRDITRSAQVVHQAQQQQQQQQEAGRGPGLAPPLSRRADRRFLFNRALLQPLLDGGADQFALPVMVGYVGQVVNPVFTQVGGRGGDGGGGGSHPEPSQQQQQEERPKEEKEEGEETRGGEEEDDDVDPGLSWSRHQRRGRRVGAGEVRGYVTLVARMAVARHGTLLWRKGLDLEGHAAHEVEVEQALTLELPGGRQRCMSHVQVRSSLPLLWSQTPDVSPVPGVRVVPDLEAQAAAFGLFVSRQAAQYGSTVLLYLPCSLRKEAAARLLLRSVVERWVHGDGQRRPAAGSRSAPAAEAATATTETAAGSGRASKVERGQQDEAEEVPLAVPLRGVGAMGLGAGRRGQGGAEGQQGERLALVVGGLGVPRLAGCRGLSLLSSPGRQQLVWEQVAAAVEGHGFFDEESVSEGGGEAGVGARQQGVLHVACWGGVDESQAVQQVVGLRVLEAQLRGSGLLEEGAELEDAYPEVLQAMRTLWNHAANVTADQVSGLGSMAGPVLRTGSLGALYRLTNLYFRAERWFHSAFLDARKQDALDLVTGAFKCTPEARALTKRSNNYSALEVGAALVLWGLSQLYLALRYNWVGLYRLAASVLLPLVAGLGVVGAGLLKGVERPQLCPEAEAPGWKGRGSL